MMAPAKDLVITVCIVQEKIVIQEVIDLVANIHQEVVAALVKDIHQDIHLAVVVMMTDVPPADNLLMIDIHQNMTTDSLVINIQTVEEADIQLALVTIQILTVIQMIDHTTPHLVEQNPFLTDMVAVMVIDTGIGTAIDMEIDMTIDMEIGTEIDMAIDTVTGMAMDMEAGMAEVQIDTVEETNIMVTMEDMEIITIS